MMSDMQPQRLDITLAFKAVSLSDVLSGTDKQVAAAIIDSFNFRTLQCDPSFDRIAHLIGKSRRTVIRAVEHLEKVAFLSKIRHGGKFHRNAYRPNWLQFRLIESQWSARRKTRHWGSTVSPSNVPAMSHIASDETVTQTILINQSSETRPPLTSQQQDATGPERARGLPTCDPCIPSSSYRSKRPSRPFTESVLTNATVASRLSAERRWNCALLSRLQHRPDLLAQAIDAIDEQLQAAATEAELTKKGSGLRYIFDQLIARGLHLC